MIRPTIILLVASSLFAGCYGNSSPTDPGTVVPRLVELLRDPEPEVRRTAAQALGKIADPGTATPLVDSLSDPDPLVRKYSAWALGNIGEPALKAAGLPLVKALGDSSEEVKEAAAQALGGVVSSAGAGQSLVELVMDALRDPTVQTRRAAVSALGLLEAGSAYLALLEALRDDDAAVRQGAVAALGELADRRAIPALGARVLNDPDAGVRAEAAFRLGKFGDGTVIAALRAASAGDSDAGVRRWAAWAVQQMDTSVNGRLPAAS
jgi:HEAT repeat protein